MSDSPRPTPLLQCSPDQWPAALVQLSIPFVSVPLGLDFIAYLHSDGLVLPRPTASFPMLKCDPRHQTSSTSEGFAQDEEETWIDQAEDEPAAGPFTLVEDCIHAALARHQALFPKLSWSAPLDAKWMTGSLRCCSPGDVLLLLKASDFVQHDLERALRPVLVLKRWMDMDPGLEFRCFVVNQRAVRACQRDAGQFHAALKDSQRRQQLWTRIVSFVNAQVVPNFDSRGGDFVVDLYVAPDRVWLVDIGPIGHEEPALVSWAELNSVGQDLAFVASPNRTDRSVERCLAMHKVPLEVATGDLTSFDQGFVQMMQSQQFQE